MFCNLNLLHVRRLLALVAVLAVAGCAEATNSSVQLREECVGRSRISVPADVEFALTSMKNWSGDENFVDPVRFSDNTHAGFSSFYYMGEIQITDAISDSDFSILRRKTEQKADENRKYFLDRDNKELAGAIRPLKSTSELVFGQEYATAVEIFTRVGKRAVGFQTNWFKTQEENRKLALYFSSNYRSRNAFEIPSGEGVCFPFGFLPDKGDGQRDISVAMRSKLIPGLIVTFEDNMLVLANAKGSNKDIAENVILPNLSTYFAKIKSTDVTSRKIDNREGAAIFVRGVNKVGRDSVAFGAVVAGNDRATSGMPSLVLRIVYSPRPQDTGRNISEKEFRVLAEQIADSIKRR